MDEQDSKYGLTLQVRDNGDDINAGWIWRAIDHRGDVIRSKGSWSVRVLAVEDGQEWLAAHDWETVSRVEVE